MNYKVSLAFVLAALTTLVSASLLLSLGEPASVKVETTPVSLFPQPTEAEYKPLVLPENKKVNATKTVSTLHVDAQNSVILVGEVGADSARIAQEIIKKTRENKAVYLLINSPGGSVLDGAQIISAMQSSKVPVNTVCLQICASMAAMIHQYGSQRMMIDRSVLMFHDAAGGLQGYFPHMKSRLKMLDSYITKLNLDISSRAKVSLKEFEAAEHDELWMDAEDAQARNFNDKIVSVTFDESLLEGPASEKLLGTKVSPKNKLGIDLKNHAR